MPVYTDILFDATEVPLVSSDGDFVTGDASNQIMFYIIKSGVGSWKEFPLVGVGLDQYVNSDIDPLELEQIIKAQLRVDIFKRAEVNAEDFPPTLVVNKTVIAV